MLMLAKSNVKIGRYLVDIFNVTIQCLKNNINPLRHLNNTILGLQNFINKITLKFPYAVDSTNEWTYIYVEI